MSWMQRPASCCQLTPNQSFVPFLRLLEPTPHAGPSPVQPSRTAFVDAKDTEIFLDRVDHLVLPTLSSSSDNPDLTLTNYTLHSSTYVYSFVCPRADSFTPPSQSSGSVSGTVLGVQVRKKKYVFLDRSTHVLLQDFI